MPTTTAPSDSFTTNTFGRRAGATWVAATGAALVLVAAAVLVASRWDQLSDLFKLGLLAGATASCAWLGHRIKPALPATGNVVFHLGLLLVPANVAAIAVHLSASLGQHLLSQGFVGAVLFTAAATATGSVVFRWASISSVPLIAAGVGALTPIPALVVLIAFAAAAEWLPQLQARHAVVVWAGLVGLAPALVATVAGMVPGATTQHALDAIGLHGMTWASGLAATAVLAWRADRDRDMRLAGLAIASAVLAGANAIGSSHLELEEGLLGVASAFVLVEVLALAVTGDRFWKQPLAIFAGVVEVPAWIVSVSFGLFGWLFAASAHEGDFFGPLTREPSIAAAFVVTAAGWVLADMRRARLGSAMANVALAISATAGVVFATASPELGAAALSAITLGFALAHRRPVLFGVIASPLAIALAAQDRYAVAAVGTTLSFSMLLQAVTADRREDAGRYLSRVLVTGACGVALWGAWLALQAPFAFAIAAVFAVAAISTAAEVGSADLADACRVWFLLPLGVVDGYQHAFFVSGAVTAVLAVDGIRLRRPALVGCAAVVAQFAVVAACLDSGLSIAHGGIALAFFAVVVSGVAAIVEEMWQKPLLAAAAVAAAFAFYLAANDAQAFTIVLFVVGALGLTAGMTTKNDAAANAGGALMGLGFLLQLNIAGVESMELYVLPVAVHLAIAGEIIRRRGPVSSWLATAPAPALVGSVAVLERIGGGSAWHALIAAVVAGAAVAVGGSRRQAGPLLTGTAILAALGVNESYSALAGMPAWGWIGIVGASLIAIAVMIERTDTSPVQVGRRLVDVIGESFD